MIAKSERLSVLSEAEHEALYGLPDFDDAQRLEYFALTEPELALVSSRPGLHAQVYCILQIGYFKVSGRSRCVPCINIAIATPTL